MSNADRPGLPRRDFLARNEDDFGAYHDIFAIVSTVSRTEAPFHAAVTGYYFPGMPLFTRQVAGVIHERDPRRVRLDGFDHVNVQVLRRGTLAAGRPGDEQAMQPGDVVVFDTSQPQRTIVEDADYVTVAVPREAITTSGELLRRLHGTVLPASAVGMLGNFLLSLGLYAHTLDEALAGRSAALARDFLAQAISSTAGNVEKLEEPAALHDVHRWRAEDYIDAHLGDRLLDATSVANGIGLSRSTIYAVFTAVHGVKRRILLRRIERLRFALLDPSDTRSVAGLASGFGFASESHCSRAFKAAYGVPPGRYRDESRRYLAARAGIGDQSWAGLWSDVLRTTATCA